MAAMGGGGGAQRRGGGDVAGCSAPAAAGSADHSPELAFMELAGLIGVPVDREQAQLCLREHGGQLEEALVAHAHAAGPVGGGAALGAAVDAGNNPSDTASSHATPRAAGVGQGGAAESGAAPREAVVQSRMLRMQGVFEKLRSPDTAEEMLLRYLERVFPRLYLQVDPQTQMPQFSNTPTRGAVEAAARAHPWCIRCRVTDECPGGWPAPGSSTGPWSKLPHSEMCPAAINGHNALLQLADLPGSATNWSIAGALAVGVECCDCGTECTEHSGRFRRIRGPPKCQNPVGGYDLASSVGPSSVVDEAGGDPAWWCPQCYYRAGVDGLSEQELTLLVTLKTAALAARRRRQATDPTWRPGESRTSRPQEPSVGTQDTRDTETEDQWRQAEEVLLKLVNEVPFLPSLVE